MIISVKRNFLELKNINDLIKKDKPEDNYSVEKTKPDFQLNKFFYKQIGKKYRWTDRLIWTDLQWSNYVSNKNLETYVIKNDKDLVGYFELIHHPEKNETELAYLGLFEDYFGNSMYTWNIEFTYFPSQQESEPTIIFGEGDTLFINTSKPFRYGDEFTLSTTMPSINQSITSDALSDIRAGKFDNDTTRRTIATAERLGIDIGDALALLAIESRFGNFNWKGKVGKGPLQIERIAHTDMVRWYSNNNNKPAGMSASEWVALRQQMMTVKDFNLVKKDEQAAITAALLFFKQIQMLGAHLRLLLSELSG